MKVREIMYSHYAHRQQRTPRKITKTATQTPALMKRIEYCSVTASSVSSSTVVTKHKTKTKIMLLIDNWDDPHSLDHIITFVVLWLLISHPLVWLCQSLSLSIIPLRCSLHAGNMCLHRLPSWLKMCCSRWIFVQIIRTCCDSDVA